MNRTQHLLSSLESRLARCDASGLWQRLRACCGVPSLASGVARVRAVMPHAAAAGASMPLPVAVGAGGGGCCWRARRVPCCMPRACRHAACVHACKPSAWGRAGVRGVCMRHRRVRRLPWRRAGAGYVRGRGMMPRTAELAVCCVCVSIGRSDHAWPLILGSNG